MRVRRAQKFEMQQHRRHVVERVARGAADDGARRRCRHAPPAGGTCFGLFYRGHAANGAFDRAIAGAATNVAFQGPRQILALRLI